MANLSITAANVVKGATATVKNGTAGASITAGQVVYLDTADGKYKLADADGAGALHVPAGIALHASLSGQPIAVLTKGPITVGATMVAGGAYALSATAGAICPIADLTTGAYPTVLGLATSTTVLNVNIQQSGVAL